MISFTNGNSLIVSARKARDMQKKITFENMEHSSPLEAHANEKLEKILEFLDEKDRTPMFIELWLKSFKTHPHHGVELHLKTPRFDLHAHDEGTDIYVVLDMTIDKMVELLKQAKAKAKDKEKKAGTEKKEFYDEDDKFTLS